MKKRAAMFVAGAALSIVTVVSTVSAQPRGARNGGGPGGGGPGGGRPHCPPAAAFEACSGAGDGDACSFAGRQGEEVTGSCAALDDGSAVCVPEGAPAPGNQPSGDN